VETARGHGIPVLVLAGTVRPDSPTLDRPDPAVTVVDLSATYGAEASWERTADCVQQATHTHLAALAR
jgi:glycerate kinase